MPKIEIRAQAGTKSAEDLVATVQDATFEYLMTNGSPKMRISAYLDQDWPMVQKTYAEIFVNEECRFETKIEQVIPGSKLRDKLTLPCAMLNGEQLTLLVTRSPRQSE